MLPIKQSLRCNYNNFRLFRSLEGISYIWLQYPELITESGKPAAVFEVVYKRFNEKLKISTKARILDTFVTFIKLQDKKVKNSKSTDKDLAKVHLVI